MARLETSHFLSVLRSSESNVGYQPRKWPQLRYAIVALLAAAIALVALRISSPPPPLVLPVPDDLEKLEPQLRAYLKDKIEWTRKAPRDMHRHATLGMVYAANALWRESRMAFQNAAQLNPKEPLARLYVAISTQEMGDFDEALKMFRQITVEFPGFPQGHYRLGDALLRAGMVEEAETGFKRLLTLAPREWRGYAGLGEVRLRKGAFAEAVSLLETAVSLDPDAKSAHHLLGQAYRGVGRLEDARLQLALGLNQTRYPMDDAWSVTAPQHMKLLQDQMDIANEYSARGQPAKAVALLKEALAYQPANSGLANALAIAYNRSGQPEKGRELLLKILQRDDRYLPGHITLSHSCADLGLADEALRYAERAIELGPNVAQSYLAKANVLLAIERDKDALSALEAASHCDTQNAEIQMELGDVCLLNLQRTEAAVEHYEKAIELNPALTPAYVRLADLHLHLGHVKEATNTIQTLRKLSPKLPELAGLDLQLSKLARPLDPK